MKKTALALAVATLASTSAFADTFVNGGFENGTLSGWTGGGGEWFWTDGLTPPIDPVIYAGGSPNNTIVGVGNDPITGDPMVKYGSYAARVNDKVNNFSVSTLSQTVNNYTNNAIYFAWNAVLESSHDLTDSDYFSLTLVDLTTNNTLVSRAYSSAGAIGSGTQGVTWRYVNGWYTSGWVEESIDVAALGAVGHNFRLTLLASDCPYGGHAGYVYLDGFGATQGGGGDDQGGNVPEPASLALLGLGLAGLAVGRRRKAG